MLYSATHRRIQIGCCCCAWSELIELFCNIDLKWGSRSCDREGDPAQQAHDLSDGEGVVAVDVEDVELVAGPRWHLGRRLPWGTWTRADWYTHCRQRPPPPWVQGRCLSPRGSRPQRERPAQIMRCEWRWGCRGRLTTSKKNVVRVEIEPPKEAQQLI